MSNRLDIIYFGEGKKGMEGRWKEGMEWGGSREK